jgi:hypothetical protein
VHLQNKGKKKEQIEPSESVSDLYPRNKTHFVSGCVWSELQHQFYPVCLACISQYYSKEECRQEKEKQEIPKRRASLYQEPTRKIQPYAQVAASFPCSYTCINNQKSIPTVI